MDSLLISRTIWKFSIKIISILRNIMAKIKENVDGQRIFEYYYIEIVGDNYFKLFHNFKNCW